MEGWKNGQFERNIKELSQFDNEKSEELDSEFDHFDAASTSPTSPFKGRNIVDLDFVYKQLLAVYYETLLPLYHQLLCTRPNAQIKIYIYIYIAKRFSNPRKESTPCDGDGKRK